MGSAGVYRWEFEKGSRSLAVSISGALIIDDMDITITAAIDGVGVAFWLDEYVAPPLRAAYSCASSRMGVRRSPASFLYHQSRR
jgi:hypothetical protein